MPGPFDRGAGLLWGGVSFALLLTIGVLYSNFANSVQTGYRWCAQNPDVCDGRELRLPIWDVVEVREDGYDLFKSVGPVPVIAETEGMERGDTVSVVGRFRASDLTVTELERHTHTLREEKKGLSGVGLLFVVVFVARRWRVTREGVRADG